MSGNGGPRGVETAIESIAGVVVEPQTYRNVVYVLLAFPLGVAYFVALTVGFSVGAALTVAVVGVPILLVVVVGSRPLAAFERTLANALLDVEIRPPDDVEPATGGDGPWATLTGYVGAGSTWKGLGFLYLKFWLGTLSFVLIVVTLAVAVVLLTAPLHYRDPAFAIQFGAWSIDTLDQAFLAVPIGIGVVVVALHVFNAVARVSGAIAEALLGEDGVLEADARQ